MIPRRFFWIFDFVTFVAAFFLAHHFAPRLHTLLLSHGLLQKPWIAAFSPEVTWTPQPFADLLWILFAAALPAIVILEFSSKYGKWVQLSLTRTLTCTFMAPFFGLALVAMVLTTLRNPAIQTSRIFLLLFAVLSAAGLSGYRILFRMSVQRKKTAGLYAKNVVIVGLPGGVQWIIQYFRENISPQEYRLCGQLHVSKENGNETGAAKLEKGTAAAGTDGVPILGEAAELGDLLVHKPIHEVIAVQPSGDAGWLSKVIDDCDQFGILLRIVPEALIASGIQRLQTVYHLQQLHLPAVVLTPLRWDSDILFIKRLLDILMSATLLVILSPLFALIAMAIKITTPRLSVFYPWHVVGRNGVRFTGYKFTTMIADADERKSDLMHLNEMTGPVFKIKDDPRVTPLGRFLRKFSLNELPQLWSVVKGDMSLVGPRPAGPHELARYEFWHKRKLSIMPGITCLWQVRGRNKICNFDDWVQMDLEYIDNWSLWLDFKILVRTAWIVVAGSGS